MKYYGSAEVNKSDIMIDILQPGLYILNTFEPGLYTLSDFNVK